MWQLSLACAVLACVATTAAANFLLYKDATGAPLWLYIIMPFMSGIIGWGTNVVALKMTFYPIEFWGIELLRFEDQPFGLFGWQGIIPTKAAKMAGITVDLMAERIIKLKDVFSRLDPKQFAEVMEPAMLRLMDTVINETMKKHFSTIWDLLPSVVRDEVVLKVLEESPKFLEAFMADVQEHIHDVFDLKHMVVTKMLKRKELLNQMFLECGKNEFIFIERSGFYLGFAFGIFQAVGWWFYKAWWLLPLCGFIVGYATNAIALKIIFEPVEPVYICGHRFQGIFLTRQKEVSAVFARLMVQQVMNSKEMWNELLYGAKREALIELLSVHTHEFVDNLCGPMKPLIVLTYGADQFYQLKEDVAIHIMQELPKYIGYGHDYTNKALGVEQIVCKAMTELSSAEFEGVLHPVFQEDELKLIVVGGVLGMAVGFLQLLMF